MRCKISRRDFMKGAAVVAASGLLVGCGGEASAPSAGSGGSSNSGSSSGSSSSSDSTSGSGSSSGSSSGTEEGPHIVWTYKKKSDGTIYLNGYDATAEIVPNGNVTIPAKYDGFVVSELRYPLFYENNDIEQVTIPETVTIIGSQAFQRCKNLLSVTLTEGLKEIGDSAFRSCGLERLTLPESLTKVGDSAFASNVALETVVIKG